MVSPLRRIPRSSSHAKIVSRTWADHLQQQVPGAEVSYATLKEMTDVDPQERRDLLDTARKLAQRLSGKVFDVITGEGLVCLSESGKLGFVGKRTERVHRSLRKTAQVLATVDQDLLTPLEKHRMLGQMSVIAIAAYVTDSKTGRQLEGKPLHEQYRITPADYQDLFKGM
jgi:hypothetical protein